MPEGRPATLRRLIGVAGRKWLVEEDFQTAKDAFGLDHSQVRTYPALLSHLVLAMVAITAAHARQTTAAPTTPSPTSPHDIPPTDTGLIPLVPPANPPGPTITRSQSRTAVLAVRLRKGVRNNREWPEGPLRLATARLQPQS